MCYPIIIILCVPADDASDGSARVIVSSATDTASIADDISLSLSSSSQFSDDGDVVVVVVVTAPLFVVVDVFFRPGHGVHHWPKHNLIKAATVHGRTCLGGS